MALSIGITAILGVCGATDGKRCDINVSVSFLLKREGIFLLMHECNEADNGE